MNKLVTSVSDDLLHRLASFLAQEADVISVGNDPAQRAEPNEAMVLLRALARETDGEFQCN
jgi:hypothetical protein